MEAIILVGIQASGKTTFYRERFAETHLRISLDMLRTRRRERIILEACLAAGQRFVVDNTNPAAADRERYILPARRAGFSVACCFFVPDPAASLARNARRPGRQRIPDKGVLGALGRLEPPDPAEGFDRIFRVVAADGCFQIEQVEQVEPDGTEFPRAPGGPARK